jgi:hypothetical protein
MQGGIQTAESASTGKNVRDKGQVEKSVVLGAVCYDDKLSSKMLYAADDTVNQRLSEKGLKSFVAAHPARLSPSLNDQTQHVLIIIGIGLDWREFPDDYKLEGFG